MKKILVIILLVFSFCTVGCSKTNAKQEAMKEYAIKFYELHLKGDTGITDSTIVKISDLKDAMTQVGDKYDMNKLEGCTDDSYVELILNDDKEVTDTVYHMICK